MEIRVCPPTLLDQVRQALPCSPAAVSWLTPLQAIAEDPTESSRGLLGHFSSTQMDLIESLFVSMGVPDPWGSIINPIWAAHMLYVAEAWDHAAESRAVPPQPEKPLANSLVSPPPEEPPEHVLVSPQMQALPETVLVAPVPRDGSFSGLERDQLATPLAHVEWPDSQSTSLVAPPPDRVPPHLKWFLAQLAVPVRCAMRSFSSILPSWSRSVWWPASCVSLVAL